MSSTHAEWFHKKFINPYGKQWENILNDHKGLIWAIETYNVKSIFEIGTWDGLSALLMWLHPNVNTLKTIDPRIEYGHKYHTPDKNVYCKYIENTNIIQEVVSSFKYVPKEGEQYDMVFIDGDHTYEAVKKDFQFAFQFNPKIIVFHDYMNGNPGVDKFINEVKSEGIYLIQQYVGSAVVYHGVEK